MIQKLDDLHENNPKMFWETIDKLKGKTIKQNPISISDWHKYMSDLYVFLLLLLLLLLLK
jgi:hypothetical protein